ncbi:S8/S53 family peptidase [Flindersiella endophytica]
MEWAVAQQARIICVALTALPTDNDPFEPVVDRLSRSSGALFVIAGGNAGPRRYTVTSPGTASEALTVAATNRDQSTADFSSAGPVRGDFASKPDIAAPGRGIVAARAADGKIGAPVGKYYSTLSGTSTAAAHVAGAAAILAQQQPTWNAGLLKTALMGTAKLPVNESVYRQGAGFLDVARAVGQKEFALESSLSAYVRWPYSRTTRTLTYRNPSATALTLSLRFEPRDQNGNPAATGVLALPSKVTVPPRGTAGVALTIDATKSKPALQYQGRITATANGVVVRTPVSVTLEPESYEVSLAIIDRNGTPIVDGTTGQFADLLYLTDLTTHREYVPVPKNGLWVTRVPRGAYSLATHVLTPTAGGPPSSTLLAEPRIAVTAPVTLTLDAREGRRSKATVDSADARTTSVGTALYERSGNSSWLHLVQLSDPAVEPEAYVVSTPRTSHFVLFVLYQQMAAPDRTYELLQWEESVIPEDPVYRVHDWELSDQAILLGTQNVKGVGQLGRWGFVGPGGGEFAFASAYPVKLPSARRHLASPHHMGGPLIDWATDLNANLATDTPAYFEYVEPRSYQASYPASVKLSTAAFSPQGHGIHLTDGWLGLDFGPFNSSGGGLITTSPGGSNGGITLKRNGVTVATSTNPYHISLGNTSGTATYTAIMRAGRSTPWPGYVPRVSGTWTFQSTRPADWSTALPILSTRVSGAFDLWGRAPAGRKFPLTLDVNGTAATIANATVRISYDDGKNWTAVPVNHATGEWIATVTHPAVAKSAWVSLRVVVTDSQGNTGGWTAIRSYKIANLG